MADIKPKYVDGEPLCSGSICELYHDACDNTNVGACKGNDGRSICIAGLRKQRDELCKERDAVVFDILQVEMDELDKIINSCDTQIKNMECCGNCTSYSFVQVWGDWRCRGKTGFDRADGNGHCDKWKLKKE